MSVVFPFHRKLVTTLTRHPPKLQDLLRMVVPRPSSGNVPCQDNGRLPWARNKVDSGKPSRKFATKKCRRLKENREETDCKEKRNIGNNAVLHIVLVRSRSNQTYPLSTTNSYWFIANKPTLFQCR